MTDKPKFDTVNVSEMAARSVVFAALDHGPRRPNLNEVSLVEAIKASGVVLQARAVDARAITGHAPVKKLRAKAGTATYGSRDPVAVRAYFRDYMRKRRARNA